MPKLVWKKEFDEITDGYHQFRNYLYIAMAGDFRFVVQGKYRLDAADWRDKRLHFVESIDQTCSVEQMDLWCDINDEVDRIPIRAKPEEAIMLFEEILRERLSNHDWLDLVLASAI